MPRTHRFGPALLATTVLALLAGGLATAAPAAAHDALVSSSPAEGEQLSAPPAQITLEFSNEVLPMGAEVLVNDTTGQNWIEGDAVINGGTVVATVADGMPAGAYEVLWKVVSADGHPISAAIPFTVLQGAPAPTPTATPTPATSTPTPTATAASTENGTDAVTSSLTPWPIIVISAAVIALLVAGLLIIVARRRRAKQADSEA